MAQQHAPIDGAARLAGNATSLTPPGFVSGLRPLSGLDEPTGSEIEAAAAALWRQAVHDLRGKLGVVTCVTALLQRPSTDARRAELIAILDRNVGGLRHLLNGVADLARLDAVLELPVMATVDIAALLGELCGNLGILASSRGLHLEYRGPPSLFAECDALMLTRMAQNLMLNAISYTTAGAVSLTCGACEDGGGNNGSWYFDIRDAPYAALGNEGEGVAARPVTPTAAVSVPGEGIGLTIVTRLCGALGGTMDIACSGAGRSTRIRLPMRYGTALQDLTIAATGAGHSNGNGTGRAMCSQGCAHAALETCANRHANPVALDPALPPFMHS